MVTLKVNYVVAAKPIQEQFKKKVVKSIQQQRETNYVATNCQKNYCRNK